MSNPFVSDSVAVTQSFLQWINKQSNCNVVIQHYVRDGWKGKISTAFRLHCEMCKASKVMDEMPRELEQGLLEFCVQHRHVIPIIGNAPVSAPAGVKRKFRED